MAERTKLTRVPPSWEPDEWWAHVATCDACSKWYENPAAAGEHHDPQPVILEPRVEHLGAGDVLLLEVPAGVPASAVEAWAQRAREVVPAGVTVLIVAGEARVMQPEEASVVVQLAHERLRTAASAVVDHFNQHGATEPLELGATIVELAQVLDSVELVEETIPRRQETYLVQKWFESERGWGQRSDGWSLHRNREELEPAPWWRRPTRRCPPASPSRSAPGAGSGGCPRSRDSSRLVASPVLRCRPWRRLRREPARGASWTSPSASSSPTSGSPAGRATTASPAGRSTSPAAP